MKIAGSIVVAAGMLAASTSGALADKVTVTGTVTDTFGHRYVVDEGGKKSLVDIGPKGRDAVTIKNGDKVTVEGELTDAGDVRAAEVAVGGEKAVVLPAGKSWMDRLTGGKDDKAPFGPVEAKAMVTKAGYETVGEPKPEKKHFEVLGKKDGKFFAVDAHRNGEIKKVHAVDASDPKWGTLVR
jgi:translation initiation factor IF-1